MTDESRASASLPSVPNDLPRVPETPATTTLSAASAADVLTVATELDLLTLTGLAVRANHGVFDFERRDGQPFVIDLAVWLDTKGAAADDDLAQTLHYGELAVEVTEAVASEPVDLIETLAERVARVVLAHDVAAKVRVTVHKPEAPIGVPFGDVSITITRSRA